MTGRKRKGARRASKVKKPLTAFGQWLGEQPRGTQSRAMMSTGLAYTTVLAAKTRRMTREVAEILSGFTGGAVAIGDIEKPSRRRALAA